MNAVATPEIKYAKAVSVAFLLGASDGQAGEPFAPEMYFCRRVDKIMYSLGFEASRGASEITREFTKSVSWEGK